MPYLKTFMGTWIIVPNVSKLLGYYALIDNVNKAGYRKIPITLSLKGSAPLEPKDIPQAMRRLCIRITENNYESANDVVGEFLRIHPFLAGNKLVGFLLYAVAGYHKTKIWLDAYAIR